MDRKTYVLGVGINPVLEQHVRLAFNKKAVFISKKGDVCASWKVLMKAFKVSKSNVLVYNTSVFNLILILILKVFRNNIFFHLHDPIPHSGLLNPIIFIVNFLSVLFSDFTIVFSCDLKNQTSKYYLPKKIIVAKHGSNPFIYKRMLNETKKIIIGFFGRNMPYKNYSKFIKYAQGCPNYFFYTIGNGYPKVNLKNHKLISGYITDNEYYSYMKDIDYVFFAHKKISYSGVLHDAINLNKKLILVSDLYQNIKYLNKTKISENRLSKKTDNLDAKNRSWADYKSIISNIKI